MTPTTSAYSHWLAERCLVAALSYERSARERPDDPEAPFWRSMAQTCRASLEGLMGWPAGAAQIPPRRRGRRLHNR